MSLEWSNGNRDLAWGMVTLAIELSTISILPTV